VRPPRRARGSCLSSFWSESTFVSELSSGCAPQPKNYHRSGLAINSPGDFKHQDRGIPGRQGRPARRIGPHQHLGGSEQQRKVDVPGSSGFGGSRQRRKIGSRTATQAWRSYSRCVGPCRCPVCKAGAVEGWVTPGGRGHLWSRSLSARFARSGDSGEPCGTLLSSDGFFVELAEEAGIACPAVGDFANVDAVVRA